MATLQHPGTSEKSIYSSDKPSEAKVTSLVLDSLVVVDDNEDSEIEAARQT